MHTHATYTYVKAAGRQESVYLETYFITLRSLFARPSREIPSCHELTSIRYAIFAAGLASILRASARLCATLRADSRNDLLFRTELYGARPYVFHPAMYIAVLLSEHQRAKKHSCEPHAVAIRKWNALLPHGRGVCISQKACAMEITAITRKTVSAPMQILPAQMRGFARVRFRARERIRSRGIRERRIALISEFIEEPTIIAAITDAMSVNPRLPYRSTRTERSIQRNGRGYGRLGKRMSDNFLRVTISHTWWSWLMSHVAPTRRRESSFRTSYKDPIFRVIVFVLADGRRFKFLAGDDSAVSWVLLNVLAHPYGPLQLIAPKTPRLKDRTMWTRKVMKAQVPIRC